MDKESGFSEVYVVEGREFESRTCRKFFVLVISAL